MRFDLGEHGSAFEAARRRWDGARTSQRLWARDARVFSNADEARWLGWLELPNAPLDAAVGGASLRRAVAEHPSDVAVVLGMGGSSLWPDVLGRTWNARRERGPAGAKYRTLLVLDTTVPDAVERALAAIPLERALFFVSSKSGSTIEPNALYELARARLVAKVGEAAASARFVAITDPNSSLEARARKDGLLGIAPGRPDVGGRFSALSPFGLLPALALGLDPEVLLVPARTMAADCGPDVSAERNPGVALGLALGTLALAGRDKLSLSLSPAIDAFGPWIEQLVAESTGKAGLGLLPITGEERHDPARYAKDRIFVDLTLAGDATAHERSAWLDGLVRAGQPVIRLALPAPEALGAAVFQWEMATAVVGSLLGINPFDQPDVEAAKIASRALLAARTAGREGGEDAGAAGVREVVAAEGLRVLAARALEERAGGSARNPKAWLSALFDSLAAGDGFVLNAFVDDRPDYRERLERIRRAVGRARPVATALSIGPRYLHSTGQLQKGGPSRLAGLQLWQSAAARRVPALAIPGLGGDFDGLAEAQAVGDLRVLAERGRRMLGIDLGSDPGAGLERLAAWVEGVLA